MKKFSLTITAGVLLLLLCGAFLFVPSGEDLISAKGDYLLGQTVGILLLLGIIVDVARLKIKK